MKNLSKKIILALSIYSLTSMSVYAAVSDDNEVLTAGRVNKIVLGRNSDAEDKSIVLGQNNYGSTNQIVIGKNNNFNEHSYKYIKREVTIFNNVETSTIVGANNTVTSNSSIAIGTNNRSSATENSSKSDWREHTVGSPTNDREKFESSHAYMFGHNNRVLSNEGLALGQSNTLGLNMLYTTNGDNETRNKLLGSLESNESTAVGFANSVAGHRGLAMGYANVVSTKDVVDKISLGIAIGNESYVANTAGTSIGFRNFVDGEFSAAYGLYNRVMGTNTVLIGSNNYDTNSLRGTESYSSSHTADYSVGLGNLLELHGKFISSVGYNNLANADYAVLLGSKLNTNMSKSLKNNYHLDNAHIGYFSSNIGYGNANFGDKSVVLGSNTNVMGDSSGVLGVNSNVYGKDSYVVGTGAFVGNPRVSFTESGKVDPSTQPIRGTALGSYSMVSRNDGVALGSKSTAFRDAGAYGYLPTLKKVATSDTELTKVLPENTDVESLAGKRNEISQLNAELANLEKEYHPIDMKYQRGDFSDSEKAQIKANLNELSRKMKEKQSAINELEKSIGSTVGSVQGQLGAVAVGDTVAGLTRQIVGVAAGSEDTDAVNVKQLKDAVSLTRGLQDIVGAKDDDLLKKPDGKTVLERLHDLEANKPAPGIDEHTLIEKLKVKADKTDVDAALAKKADKDAGNLSNDNVNSWKQKLGIKDDTASKQDVDKKADKDAGNLSDDNVNSWKEKLGIKDDHRAEQALREVGVLRDDLKATTSLTSALAGLKPLSYNPYDKNQLMFGFGSYKGETSFAIGLAHQPNSGVMYHLGMAYNHRVHTAINGGVSIRLGRGHKANLDAIDKNTDVFEALAIERSINQQQQEALANQAQEIKELKAKLDVLMKKLG